MERITIGYLKGGESESVSYEGSKVGYTPNYDGLTRVWVRTEDEEHTFLVPQERVEYIDVIQRRKDI